MAAALGFCGVLCKVSSEGTCPLCALGCLLDTSDWTPSRQLQLCATNLERLESRVPEEACQARVVGQGSAPYHHAPSSYTIQEAPLCPWRPLTCSVSWTSSSMLFLVCECACVHFNVGTHGCGHTKVRELLQGTRTLSSLFPRQSFSLNLELGDLARLAS